MSINAYSSQKNRCYTLENDKFDDYNLNLKFCSPTPVGMLKNTGNNSEIYDLRGNVWEWLEDDFNPLTDFQPHYLYADNSTPFFNVNEITPNLYSLTNTWLLLSVVFFCGKYLKLQRI